MHTETPKDHDMCEHSRIYIRASRVSLLGTWLGLACYSYVIAYKHGDEKL